MTKKLFLFAVIFCLFISGCDSAHPFGKWKKDSGDIEEFRIGVIGFKDYYDTYTFLPYEADGFSATFIFGSIIDNQFNNDLVENIVFSENGMECVVQLRKNVFFHNGSKLTPEDIIYTLNELKEIMSSNNPSARINSSSIIHMTAENMDEGKLFFKLGVPGSSKNNLVSLVIVSKQHEEIYKKKSPLEYKPNGVGPMRFANYDRSKGILTLERFDGYYAGILKIKKIIFISYSDGDSLEMALLKGEIDYSTVQGSFDKRIKNNIKYAWFERPLWSCTSIIFDTMSSKLKDWRVRKALSLLIDRDAIINASYGLGGHATPADVAFSYSHPETKPVSDKPDPKRAMELFREAGYKRINGKLMRNGKRMGLTVNIFQRDLQYSSNYVRLLGKMWEGAGINITLKEGKLFQFTANRENYEVVIHTPVDRFMLSDNVRIINSNKIETYMPSANFSDRELERLFLEFSKETRESVLLEKKALIQQRIKDMCPIVPLFYKDEWFVLGGKLVKDDHLVKTIEKDPFLLTHLRRYVR